MIPLTRKAGGLQAYKMIIPHRKGEPDLQRHEGYEWMYVLNGRLRLILGDHELVLGPGEAAEFDTRVAHWFGSADDERRGDPVPVRQSGRAGPPAGEHPPEGPLLIG